MTGPRLVRLTPIEPADAIMLDDPPLRLHRDVTTRRVILRAIVAAGLAAGLLDLAAALIQAWTGGLTTTRLFQAIASGWFGRASYSMGMTSAALGLVSHFMVAFGAATVFVLAARRMPFLISVAWLSGPVYGMIVWATMRFVVLPLSAYPHIQPIDPSRMAIAVLIHITCVGLPIALAARWALGERRA